MTDKQIEIQKVLNVLCKYIRVKTGIEIVTCWIEYAIRVAKLILDAYIAASIIKSPSLKEYQVGEIVKGNQEFGKGELVNLPTGSIILNHISKELAQNSKEINLKGININNIDDFINKLKDIK